MFNEELSRLTVMNAFMKEGENEDPKKKNRYRASDLYEPIDIFCQLKLPVLDWGEKHKWRSTSEEGRTVEI